MEKVSIIISTYNRKELLKNAIKSALMQTYKNIEVLVVDDHSHYNIFDVLEELEDKIRIIKNKRNVGSAATYNVGIKESSGEYVTILNDDDLFHPRKIEIQMSILNKRRDVGFVYCPIGILIKNEIFYKPVKDDRQGLFESIFFNRMCITPLVKKECFSVCGLFDESMTYHEDRELWYRIGKKYPFAFDERPSYILYNRKIDRLSSQIERIHSSKKELFEKYKIDFKNQKKFFSEYYYELAYDYLLRGYYKIFFEQFKQSIQNNPKIIKKFLYEYSTIPLGRFSFRYKRIKIDNDLKELFIELDNYQNFWKESNST